MPKLACPVRLDTPAERLTRYRPDVCQAANVLTEASYNNRLYWPWLRNRRISNSVAQFRHAYCYFYHQRLIECRSGAKKAFCSDLFILWRIADAFCEFLPSVSIACDALVDCYAEPCISYMVGMSVRPVSVSSVRLSECLSVTRWHCVKTTQARITKSSSMDRSRILVLALKSSSRNSKGFTPSEGVKWDSGKKNSQMSANKSIAVSQKRCKIGTKLLLMTSRKSHTPFGLVPKSTTLDDLERPIRTLLQKRCVFRSLLTKIWLKIDPFFPGKNACQCWFFL